MSFTPLHVFLKILKTYYISEYCVITYKCILYAHVCIFTYNPTPTPFLLILNKKLYDYYIILLLLLLLLLIIISLINS